MFWLGAAVSLCYVPGLTGAYIATQWPLLAFLMPFALLRRGPYTIAHTAGLLFAIYAVVRATYSPIPYFSVMGLWLVVITGLCMWFGTTLKDVRGLYAGLAAGAAVSSGLAIVQYFGFTTVPTNSGTPTGLYFNGVQQGTVLALIAVALVSERMWIWALPLLPGIWLAHSRGGWLVLVVGLAACYLRRAWVLSIVVAAGALYLLSPLSHSDAQRMLIWQFATASLRWLGWGAGMFYTVALPHDGTFSFYPEYAHNDALQLLWEYGIGAAIPIGIVGYALYRSDIKEWPVVVAFVTAGCYSMPLFMPVTAFLAFVAVGRVLRSDGVVVSYSGNRGQYGVSWACALRSQAFSLGSHHTAKG